MPYEQGGDNRDEHGRGAQQVATYGGARVREAFEAQDEQHRGHQVGELDISSGDISGKHD